MPVTSLPSSSNSLTSTTGAGWPHEPGLRSWSSGSRMQFTPSSVEPYTSHSESAGKSARYICLSAKLHGAALAIMRFIDDVSYFAFTSSGRLQTIRIGVGAAKVDVTRYVSTSRSQSSGSNLRCSTTVWPSAWAMRHEAAGAGVVQRTGGQVHVVGRVADELRASPPPGSGRRRWGAAHPSACRSCRTCRSSSRRPPGPPVRPARRRLAAAISSSADEHPRRRRRRRTRGRARPSGCRRGSARTSARTRRRRRRWWRRSGR